MLVFTFFGTIYVNIKLKVVFVLKMYALRNDTLERVIVLEYFPILIYAIL